MSAPLNLRQRVLLKMGGVHVISAGIAVRHV